MGATLYEDNGKRVVRAGQDVNVKLDFKFSVRGYDHLLSSEFDFVDCACNL